MSTSRRHPRRVAAVAAMATISAAALAGCGSTTASNAVSSAVAAASSAGAAVQSAASSAAQQLQSAASSMASMASSAASEMASKVTSGPASTTVTASDAWVRAQLIPESTGAYATLTNSGATEVSLVGVSVPMDAAMTAEIHTTTMVDGEMKMEPVGKPLPIPAGGSLELKAGGYHVMLMGPKDLTEGKTVPITFLLSDGTTVTTDAPVKAPAPTASASMSSMG